MREPDLRQPWEYCELIFATTRVSDIEEIKDEVEEKANVQVIGNTELEKDHKDVSMNKAKEYYWQYLKTLGDQRWELVNAVENILVVPGVSGTRRVLFFKRPKNLT